MMPANRPIESSIIRAYGDSVWRLSLTRTEINDDLTNATLTFTLYAGSNSVVPSVTKTINASDQQEFRILLTAAQKSTLLAGNSSAQVEWQYSLSAAGQADGANVIGPEGSGYQGKFTLRN